MSKVAPGQILIVRAREPRGGDVISLAVGLPQELDDAVARIRLEAAINRHDSHNERASPKRYGKTRCMDCKKKIARAPYNWCRKCEKYVCVRCGSVGGQHEFIHNLPQGPML